MTQIKTLLIANRGEIACRIIKTAREMGIKTIAVYSSADANARHVREADVAVHIGAAPARESYLKSENILKVAKEQGADAIHPGYGFLSENPDFAGDCAKAGVIFVGPSPEAITAMGLKDAAKKLMRAAGVPVVPGYEGKDQSDETLLSEAKKIGYPVAIKAVAGGGGRGLRRVEKEEDFLDALRSAQRESQAAFGNDKMLLEKWVTSPRHIEIQILADAHGNTIHLGERDCSLQRRNQKVIEEAPAPGMTNALRKKMGDAAISAAKAVNYTNAGTVEFIVPGDKPLSDETPFYFMEMNTRLQVEHPVTELITGLDLVKEQLDIAAGHPLKQTQQDIALNGHAIEVRVTAEDPENEFLPDQGRLEDVFIADDCGARIDTGFETGDSVPQDYDSLIAKIITHGQTRDIARQQLIETLKMTSIAGIKTTLPLLHDLLEDENFANGTVETALVANVMKTWDANATRPSLQIIAATALSLKCDDLWDMDREDEDDALAQIAASPESPWAIADGFAIDGAAHTQMITTRVDYKPEPLRIAFDDGTITATDGTVVAPDESLFVSLSSDGKTAYVNAKGRIHTVTFDHTQQDPNAAIDEAGDGAILAPLPGKISAVWVKEGEAVKRGDKLCVLEAMKIEHVLTAPTTGTVTACHIKAGDQVERFQMCIEIDE